ncbi:MAG: hypothetical protein MZV64_17875 [Ignavibacteriales bacterium]|nr:hypothetical protein [Ignavibacteriales bacterium]
MDARTRIRHRIGQFFGRPAVAAAQVVVDRVGSGGDQPAFEAGLRSLPFLRGFEQAHEHIAGDVLRHRVIVDPVTDVTIDFQEILIVDGADGLRVQPSQPVQRTLVII